MTRSRQAQCAGTLTDRTWDNVDTRYMWNYGMCKGLIAQNIKKHWCIPLIQGYVDHQQPSPECQLILVARRRWRMGGTRYHARGIDDLGNVSNHAELEQIVYME